MLPLPRLALLCLCLVPVGSCGGEPAAPAAPGETHPILARVAADDRGAALAEALAAHPAAKAVFAPSGRAAARAVATTTAAQRGEVAIVRSVGPAVAIPAATPFAAACQPQGLAEAVVDLALLACSGIATPPHVAVGARYLTKHNLQAGGTRVPAPGDFALELLRRQHAEVLSTTPSIDVVFRIGLVCPEHGGPYELPLARELAAAAKRYPQVQLLARPANDAAGRQQALAELVRENCNAIVIAPGAAGELAEGCAAAQAQGIKLLVVGDAPDAKTPVCRVTADEAALGRAAAEAVQALLPAGGGVLEMLDGNVEQSRAFGEGLRRRPS